MHTLALEVVLLLFDTVDDIWNRLTIDTSIDKVGSCPPLFLGKDR